MPTMTSAPVVGVDAPPADGPGFVAWVRPHLAAMSWLAARLGAGADRDEVVQEALARAWAKRSQYAATRRTAEYDASRRAGECDASGRAARVGVAGWLLGITAERARRAARRGRDVLVDDDLAVGRAGLDARMDVELAIRGLPSRQRLAVDCYYFADLSVAETAMVMGCSEDTVRSILADARARLRPLVEVTE